MLHRHQSLSPTLAQVYKLAPADRDAHTDTDLSAMTETSVAGVRSDVKKVIEASVCSRSVVRDAALSWRSAGRAGGGGSNDGNPVAWLQPSAYGGERRHHPVRATCLIGAGRQGQSILKQCEPATCQLPVCEEELGEVVLATTSSSLRPAAFSDQSCPSRAFAAVVRFEKTWFPSCLFLDLPFR